MDAQPDDRRHLGDDTTFARAFEAAWADASAARLAALLHPEVTLYQPTVPPLRGRNAALRDFTALFRWLPGTRATVDHSMTLGDTCYIAFRLQFPIGDGRLEVRAVDHFVLKDGKAYSRRAHFDPMPLVVAVAVRPWLWWGFLRYRFQL